MKMQIGIAALVAAALVVTVTQVNAVPLAGSGNAELVGTVPCMRLDVATTPANIDLPPGRYQVTASAGATFLIGPEDPEDPATCTAMCGVELPAGVPMETATDRAAKLRARTASGAGRLNICRIVSGRAG